MFDTPLARALSLSFLCAALAAPMLQAADLSTYRGFRFGMSTAQAANQAGMKMKRSDDDAHIGANAVFKRPGYRNPRERLTDMDADGVNIEVLYSEVSAFRYIPDLKTGAGEATRAFNDALDEFASANRDRLCVSYQIPIHDTDFAVVEAVIGERLPLLREAVAELKRIDANTK